MSARGQEVPTVVTMSQALIKWFQFFFSNYDWHYFRIQLHCGGHNTNNIFIFSIRIYIQQPSIAMKISSDICLGMLSVPRIQNCSLLIISKDKYTSILLHQMEAIVLIIIIYQIFFAACMVLTIGKFHLHISQVLHITWIFRCDMFRPIPIEQKYLDGL